MSEQKKEERVYLVQMRKGIAGSVGWSDVDLITVPSGTKRRTLLEKVRGMDLGLDVGEMAMIRFIPEEHAVMSQVSMVQPAPQMQVGS